MGLEFCFWEDNQDAIRENTSGLQAFGLVLCQIEHDSGRNRVPVCSLLQDVRFGSFRRFLLWFGESVTA
jgi:hypothetical protein